MFMATDVISFQATLINGELQCNLDVLIWFLLCFDNCQCQINVLERPHFMHLKPLLSLKKKYAKR